MDLIFCGITDIILILFFIFAIIWGAKKGFMSKFISLSSGIVGLIVAIIFCSRFANMLIEHQVFYPAIQNNIYENITSSGLMTETSSASDVLSGLGFPGVIADYIGSKIDSSLTGSSLATTMAQETAKLFMVIISFAILLIGCWVLTFVIKLLIKLIRASLVIRIVDGVLGVVLYGFLAIICIYILFFILSLVIQIPGLEGFRNFMTVDMQLDTDKFRLSKYFYENNILINFFRLFF